MPVERRGNPAEGPKVRKGQAARKTTAPRGEPPVRTGVSTPKDSDTTTVPREKLTINDLRAQLESRYGANKAALYLMFLTSPNFSETMDIPAIQEELLRENLKVNEINLAQIRRISNETQTRIPEQVKEARADLGYFFSQTYDEQKPSDADYFRSAGYTLIFSGDLQYGETSDPAVDIIAVADPPHKFPALEYLQRVPRDLELYWEEFYAGSEKPYFAIVPLSIFNNLTDMIRIYHSHLDNLGPMLTGMPLFPEEDTERVAAIQNQVRQIITSDPLYIAIVNTYLVEELQIRSSGMPAHLSEQISLPVEPEETARRELRISIQADAAEGVDEATLITKYKIDPSQLAVLLEPHPEDFRPIEGHTRHTWTQKERAALIRAIAIDSTPTESRPALTFDELAEKYNLGRSTLAKLRKEAQVGGIIGPPTTQEEKAAIIQDATKGISVKQLVDKYGKSRSTISLILASANLGQERGHAQKVLDIWQAGQQQLTYNELRKQALQAGLTSTQFIAAVRHLSRKNYPIPRATTRNQPTEE